MSISVTQLVLLLCAAVGALAVIRLRRHRKYKHECRLHQEEAHRKMMNDRITLEEIRVRLAHEETVSTDPNVVVHYFELDEHGRGPHERFLAGLPELPPLQLHGDDLNTIDCPDFYKYRIPGQANAA